MSEVALKYQNGSLLPWQLGAYGIFKKLFNFLEIPTAAH